MKPKNGSEFIAMISVILEKYPAWLSEDSKNLLYRIAYRLLLDVTDEHDDIILTIAKEIPGYTEFIENYKILEQIKQKGKLQSAINTNVQLVIQPINTFLGDLSNKLLNSIDEYDRDNATVISDSKAAQTNFLELRKISSVTKLILELEKKDNEQLRTYVDWDKTAASKLRYQLEFIKSATRKGEHSGVLDKFYMDPHKREYDLPSIFWLDSNYSLNKFINEVEPLLFQIMQNLLNISKRKNNDQLPGREIVSVKKDAHYNTMLIPSLNPTLLCKKQFGTIIEYISRKLAENPPAFQLPEYTNPEVLKFADAFMEQCRMQNAERQMQYLLRLDNLLDMSAQLLKLHDMQGEHNFANLIRSISIEELSNISYSAEVIKQLEAKKRFFNEFNLSEIVGSDGSDNCDSKSDIDGLKSVLNLDHSFDMNASLSLESIGKDEGEQQVKLAASATIDLETRQRRVHTDVYKQVQQDESASLLKKDSEISDLKELKLRRIQAFCASIICLFVFDALLFFTLSYKVPIYAYIALGGLLLAFCIFAYLGYDANKQIRRLQNGKMLTNQPLQQNIIALDEITPDNLKINAKTTKQQLGANLRQESTAMNSDKR